MRKGSERVRQPNQEQPSLRVLIEKGKASGKRDRRAVIASHAVDSNSDHDGNLVHRGQEKPGFEHIKNKGPALQLK